MLSRQTDFGIVSLLSNELQVLSDTISCTEVIIRQKVVFGLNQHFIVHFWPMYSMIFQSRVMNMGF